jgi:hypothetical protein
VAGNVFGIQGDGDDAQWDFCATQEDEAKLFEWQHWNGQLNSRHTSVVRPITALHAVGAVVGAECVHQRTVASCTGEFKIRCIYLMLGESISWFCLDVSFLDLLANSRTRIVKNRKSTFGSVVPG